MSLPRIATATAVGLCLTGCCLAGCCLTGCASHVQAPAPLVRSAASAHPRATPADPPDTYLAEGQDVYGTTAQRPSCSSGCPLNSLGTVVLYDMTWRAWNGRAATGAGTETIQSCETICSGMPQYQAKVTVTLSHPVEDCAAGQAYWTRAVFGYPDGLGDAPAPPDPWTFTAVAAAASATCHH